jgi:hypothetical protein
VTAENEPEEVFLEDDDFPPPPSPDLVQSADDNEFGEPFDVPSSLVHPPSLVVQSTPPAPGELDSEGFRTPRGEPVRSKRSGTPLRTISPKKCKRTGLAFKVCMCRMCYLLLMFVVQCENTCSC